MVAPMKVISVNVGLPRTIQWKGRTVSTGIYKAPVSGRVPLRSLNLDGDRQADLSVHGGPYKAVYAYPVEHYAYWRREFPDMALPWGMFGENLTTEGLSAEDALQVGDRFRIGSAELVVTQPRLPCYKLGLRFGRDDMARRFLASGRTGFYLRVAGEGDVAAGGPIVQKGRAEGSIPVSELTRLYARDKDDLEGLRRIVQVAALPDDWRDYFKRRISEVSARHERRSGLVVTTAGLLAEEVSALRRLAQDRRAASFVRFRNGGRPVQPFGPEMPEKADLLVNLPSISARNDRS